MENFHDREAKLPLAGLIKNLSGLTISWATLWLIAFIMLFAWRLQNLDAFGLSNDEGAYLMWARLTTEGYSLYHETQAVQAPLFIEGIGWALRLGGVTVQAGRWVGLLGFGLLAITLSVLAYWAGSWPATLTSLLLVGLSPLIFTSSRQVMAELPATAFAAISITLLFLFLKRGGKGWLVVSGGALGASFLIKALNPGVLALVGLLLLIYHSPAERRPVEGGTRSLLSLNKRWKQLWLDLFYWSLGFCLPLVLPLFFYEPAALYDQLIAFRADLRMAIPGSWSETWSHFRVFISSHWGFWLLAMGGILIPVLVRSPKLIVGTRNKQGADQVIPVALYNLIWGVWLIAGMVMLAWHTPLFPHHFIVLLPPLILLAARAMPNFIALWPEWRHSGPVRRSLGIVLLLLVSGAALNGSSMIKANQATAAIVTGGREQEALRLLEAVSGPNDFVMGDSQLLIFMANRRTPPPMGDVALVAIKANRQTSTKMIELTNTYQSPAVVQWSLRLPWLPEYLAWVQANYLARRVWDGDHIIYFGRRLPADQAVPNAVSVRFGRSLVLRGFQLDPAPIKPGRALNLKTYWQTHAPLRADYTIFTQLLDPHGVLAVSQDSQPLGGYFPTSRWPAGDIVTDIVHLPLPADLPAGDYTLITGLYLLETSERLPVLDSNHDYVILTKIKISEE